MFDSNPYLTSSFATQSLGKEILHMVPLYRDTTEAEVLKVGVIYPSLKYLASLMVYMWLYPKADW
jgi:hypothetical protein